MVISRKARVPRTFTLWLSDHQVANYVTNTVGKLLKANFLASRTQPLWKIYPAIQDWDPMTGCDSLMWRSMDPRFRGRRQSNHPRESQSASDRRVPFRANIFSQSQSRHSLSQVGTFSRESQLSSQRPRDSQPAQTQSSQSLFRSQLGFTLISDWSIVSSNKHQEIPHKLGQSQLRMSNSKSSLKTYSSKKDVATQVTPKRMARLARF